MTKPRLLRVRPPRKDTLVCAVLCFVCALLSFGFFMLQDGGAFTLREDFDFQQMPFTMALHNQIARGGIAGWCWNLDLGASAIQGFGFYELGSPFFWLSMLFPANSFPYVVGWIYILKYMVAGITAHLYIRRFVTSARAATAGALLYAFSGFQATNLLFYHFHDVVALFPLLLIGLERLMRDKHDFPCFVLAVCINAFTSYFFFVQSFVFLLLYFGFRFGPRLAQERRLLAGVGRCFAYGVLGVGMAAALMAPSFVYMLSNPRAGSSALQISNIAWDPWQLLFQVQGFLLPADPMFDHNAVIDKQWTSTSCWLPMVGVMPVVAYLKERRDWLARLLVALMAICLSPLLTSAFTLFTNIYQRWWYTLVLMAALASAHVIDRPKDFDLRVATIASVTLVVAFIAVVVVGSQAVGVVSLFHADRFALYGALSLGGMGITYLLLRKTSTTRKQPHDAWLLACIAAFAVVSTSLTLYLYRQNLYVGELLDNISSEEQRMGTLKSIELGTQLKTLDAQYRYATGDNQLTLTGEAAGLSSFSSTVSSASGRFDELFGTPATNVWHLNKSLVPGLPELLGGRFHITTEPGNREVVDQHQVGDTLYYVVSQDACPLGFACDAYLLQEDVEALPANQRAIALMQASVVAGTDEHAVRDYAVRVTPDELELAQPVSKLVAKTQARAVRDFWRNDGGFGFSIDAQSPELVYLSIPHDSGWTAYVDDTQAATVDSAGMMLLPVGAGTHNVVFTYTTPGLHVGIMVSLASCAAFATLLVTAHGLASRFDRPAAAMRHGEEGFRAEKGLRTPFFGLGNRGGAEAHVPTCGFPGPVTARTAKRHPEKVYEHGFRPRNRPPRDASGTRAPGTVCDRWLGSEKQPLLLIDWRRTRVDGPSPQCYDL